MRSYQKCQREERIPIYKRKCIRIDPKSVCTRTMITRRIRGVFKCKHDHTMKLETQNETCTSVRYCRLIYLEFAKETLEQGL